MINEVTTYQAVCDGCGRKTGRYNSMEKLNANGDFWAWVEIDGKLYCPECYGHDEETNEYKPKKEGGINHVACERFRRGTLHV